MQDKQILLGITGGIAAYKSAELCRLFVKAGAAVQVVMSEAATHFVTPLTFETLSGRPVPVAMFRRGARQVEHIELAGGADVMVVAPATADYLARSAAGRASDLISSVTLAFTGPVLAAPAMNTNMWNNPATRRNLNTLAEQHGWHFVAPGTGELACGWSGQGRMAEPAEIFEATARLFRRDLTGKTLLITAGPTVEDLDPVRFISNRSSGKMGYAIAAAAAARGASVCLVSGPTALPCPPGVERWPVRSALEMQAAVNDRAQGCDAIIMTAAVADFRPAACADHKLKKSQDEQERVIRLVRNPDILEGLGARFKGQSRPVLVGFCVETQNVEAAATAKLVSKGAHLIVGNLAKDGFGGDDNDAVFASANGLERPGRMSKSTLAERLVDRLTILFIG